MASDKVTISDGFDIEITQAQNNVKVLLLDMAVWHQKLQSEFPGTKLKSTIRLEQLDLTYSLPGLAEAPFPALGDLETRAERSTALLQQWRTHASVGLRLFVAQQGGAWRSAGTLPLQNHGSENWQPLLQPFLTSTNEVFLLSDRARIAVEIINLGNGLLTPVDRLTIRGGFVAEVTIYSTPDKATIKQRRNLTFNLVNGVATQVLSWNQDRKYLYLSNTGTSNIYFIFGSSEELMRDAVTNNNIATQVNGLLLTPMGTANFNNLLYIEPAPVTAIAIGGVGRLSLMEGW